MLRYQHTTRSWGLFSGYILLRGGCSVDLLASAVGAESALETSYRAAAMTVNLEAFSTITAASSTPNDRRATRETTGPAAGGGADAPSSESRRRLGAPRASSGCGGCGPLGLLLCARSTARAPPARPARAPARRCGTGEAMGGDTNSWEGWPEPGHKKRPLEPGYGFKVLWWSLPSVQPNS